MQPHGSGAAVAATGEPVLEGSPAWPDDAALHPDDIGKRIYSDETGRTFILDDPLPVQSPEACWLPRMCRQTTACCRRTG